MKKKYHVGYTCGVFDVFHVGHLNLLERCKSMCDILIVGVCDDTYVREYKHKEPVYPEDQRVRILKALKVVDDAGISVDEGRPAFWVGLGQPDARTAELTGHGALRVE